MKPGAFGARATAAALLAALAALLVPAVAVAVPAAAQPPQQLTVNLSADTGPVFHGASGALYGLSENGVPGTGLFDPLHVRAVDAAPPDGQQHPTGHADHVAPEFFGAGGQWMLVYMQDIYSAWPYQNLGLSDYLPKVETIVRKLMATPYANRFAYAPFNEPDWIWYGLGTTDPAQYAQNRDRFLADWSTVYHAIRSIDPSALIVGPNEAYYDNRFLPDFLSYAKAHNVLPDIMSWHELSSTSPQTYRSSYASYRALEKQEGIRPLPVDIDEYSTRQDLSNPGTMVQWLSMFEDTKVYAAMPFWDIADNYSDTAVRNDEPNGQWWLLDWYGALTGDTVQVTPPQPNTVNTPQGLAALDRGNKQARIIVSDPSGGNDTVRIRGIDPAIFGNTVHVSVQKVNWSGLDGNDYTPLDAAETSYPVSGGSVTVPLGPASTMSAYQLIVTPATGARIAAPPQPGTQTYLAADASITDATVVPQGNAGAYATAGGKDVESISKPDSQVTFHVTAPRGGRYLMSVYYGNPNATIAQQILRVDGGPWSFVSYPPTLNAQFWSHKDMYLNLVPGAHTITFGVSDPSIGTARDWATLDDIQLTYAPGEVPGVTGPATGYPAAYAELSSGAATVPCAAGSSCAAPQDVTLPPGGGTAFLVDAGHDGYYDLGLRGAPGQSAAPAPLRLLVDGTQAGDAPQQPFGSFLTSARVYLHAGINPVNFSNVGSHAVAADSLAVQQDAADGTAYQAAAPQNVLSGTATVQADPYASGGKYVGGIGGGSGNTLTFTGVRAPRAGTYRVMLSYADNDRAGSGNYNSNLIDRGFTVTTSAGTSETGYARNTYSWDQFDTVELTVTLAAGTNTITFGNPAAPAPDIDKITVAPAFLP